MDDDAKARERGKSVLLPPDLHLRAKVAAAKSGKTVKDIVAAGLEHELSREERDEVA
jgi:hypothetical protein